MLFFKKPISQPEDFDFIRHSPSVAWIHDRRKEVENTPDFWHLRMFEKQRLFVFDETMDGHRHHSEIPPGSEYLGTALTGPNYTLWKKNLGEESWAMAMEQEFLSHPSAPKARIKGELYNIPSYDYLSIDRRMNNTVSFIRKRVRVYIPYRRILKDVTNPLEGYLNSKLDRLCGPSPYKLHLPKVVYTTPTKIMSVDAWMYVANQEYWDKHLTDILYSPIRRYVSPNPDIGEYYYFTKREYKNK